MSNLFSPHSNGVDLNLDELLYYRNQSVQWLPPAKSLWSQMLGHHQSRQLGRGMDFSESRQYQAGDDIRAIDWRVTARTGKAHTKLFSEEREKPLVLFLDLSPSMVFGSNLMLKSVLMAHMASLIAWLTVAQQDRVGAVIDTGTELIELKPMGRNKGPLVILQRLVEVHARILNRPRETETHSFQPALSALRRLTPKGGEIVFISDFIRLTDHEQHALSQLKQHNSVRFVHVSDPLEFGATAYRGYEKISDGSRTQWLDFSSKKTRQQIEVAFNNKLQGLKTLAQKTGISFCALSSDRLLLNQISG
ncbi:DUF58 domain-containing protein [Vibrio panuliri]|uniref:Cytosolic protein n=1 Tax=Vibrio panuliri TaxID=1381081 RepID=A0ABX3F8U0_9VIBR|nr:DUF58 domain-containing protein [Vibrio panuliri]KAB1457648.1 DUF58 domain-containing protein [Vibrio panuliri]OLQ87296.1 cytosolic protein [Vibrio panuliri]